MEKVDNFRNRLRQSIIDSGMSQIEVANKAGISKSLLNKYLKGVSEAGNHKLLLLANALGVNPVWLMGYDVDKYKIPEAPSKDNERNDLIRQIENTCKLANIDDLKTFLRIIKSIVNK